MYSTVASTVMATRVFMLLLRHAFTVLLVRRLLLRAAALLLVLRLL